MPFKKKPDPLTPEQALAYALRLLNQRDYSQSRLKRKIVERGGTKEDADTIVTRVAAMGLVDDARLAANVAKNESNYRHQSQRAIATKLMIKGIPKEIIDATLPTTEDESERAVYHAKKWLAKHNALEQREQTQKLLAYLYRKGFSSQSTRHALQAARLPDDESLLE